MEMEEVCGRKVAAKFASDAVVREPKPLRKRAKAPPRKPLNKPPQSERAPDQLEQSVLINHSESEFKATPESQTPSVVKASVVKASVVKPSVVKASVVKPSARKASVVKASAVKPSARKASVVKASAVKPSVVKPSVLPQVGVPNLGADSQQYGVYVLANTVDRRTYVGCTNDFARRRRQHCGFLVGGAKATRGCATWYFHACVTGFATRHMALSFEWYVKRYRKYTPADLQAAAQILALTPTLNPALALHAAGARFKPVHKRTLQLGRLLAKFGGEGGRFPNLTVHYLAVPDTSFI